jgi:hypothetical protein
MITHKILTQDPVPVERLVPDVSPEIVGIVRKTLRKAAAERYANSEALREAISRARREFSSNAAWNAPTVLTSRDTPPEGKGSRGTGSARRRQDDVVSVAQLTPPPDPRRADRDAIARRRTALIESALEQARTLLALGHLDAALDACQQALAFDETHPGALDLEVEINVAIGLREHAARTSAATAATPRSSDVAPAEAVTRLDEQSRVPAPSPGVSTPRTPAPVPPPAAPPPAAAPAARKATTGFSVLATKAMWDKRTFVGLAAGIVLIVAVAGGFMLLAPAGTGSVVIDATPWGTVTSIESESGTPQPLPADASTPVFLTLPAGDYLVTVTGPSPDSPPQRIGIRVDAAAQVVAPLVRFHVLTPEEYFEEYLASPATP